MFITVPLCFSSNCKSEVEVLYILKIKSLFASLISEDLLVPSEVTL